MNRRRLFLNTLLNGFFYLFVVIIAIIFTAIIAFGQWRSDNYGWAKTAYAADIVLDDCRSYGGTEFVYDRSDSTVCLPRSFVFGSLDIVSCESKWNPYARGDKGLAYGFYQVRIDYHKEDMARNNLDFNKERHRLLWAAYWLYGRWDGLDKYQDWSCS